MLNNKSYRDKTIAEFFDRNSEPANVDGVLHSTPFRKINANSDPEFVGRKKLVGTDANGNKVYEKIKDDVQFAGKSANYDGINDYSYSNFQPHDWNNNSPINNPLQITDDILIDYKIVTNSSWSDFQMVFGIDEYSSAHSGIISHMYSSYLVVSIYGEVYTNIILNPYTFTNGVEYRFTIHIYYIGGLQYKKLYINGNLEHSSSIASTFVFMNPVISSRLTLGAWVHTLYGNMFKGKFIYFDLYKVGTYTDAHVTELLANRDALNEHLYARFNLNEGTGNKTYASNDPTKYLNHANINESTFWADDSDVDYSPLNEKGYSLNHGIKLNGAGTYPIVKSNFTLHDWSGISSLTNPWELPTGILIDFTIKCDTLPVNRYELVSMSHFTSGYSGLLVTIGSTGNLWGDIYAQTYMGYGYTENLCNGIERRITIHIRFDSGTMYFKTYYDGILKESRSNASSYIGFSASPSSALVLGSWSTDVAINHYNGIFRNFDLFNTADYSDAQVASYLADRNSMNENLYARFLINEGSGVTTNADNDPTKKLNLSFVNWDLNYKLASLINSDIDINGDPLQFKGKLAPRAQLVNAPCLSLNGVDQYVSFNTSTDFVFSTTNFEIGITLKPTLLSNYQSIIGLGYQNTTVTGFCIYAMANGTIELWRGGTPALKLGTTTNKIQNNVWSTIKVTRVESNLIVDIDGNKETVYSASILNLGQTTNNFIGRNIGGNYFKGSVVDFYIQKDSVNNMKLPFSEGNGTIVYDVSGNDNHGTVTNAILPDIWTTQNVFHYSQVYGYQPALRLANLQYITVPDIPYGTSYSSSGLLNKVLLFIIKPNNDDIFNLGYGPLYQTLYKLGNIFYMKGADSAAATPFTFPVTFDNSEPLYVVITSTPNSLYTMTVNNVPSNESPQLINTGNGFRIQTLGYSGDMNYIYFATNYLGYNITAQQIEDFCNGIWLPEDSTMNRVYRFTEKSGVTVYDSSGGGNHGTIQAAANNWIKLPNRIAPNFIKGSNQGNKWNGASDIQFPNIPEITKELRGKVLSKDEIEGLKYARTILDDNGSLTLFKDKVESIQFLRKANRLLLDDYNTSIPSVASYRISSTFNDYCFLVVRESDMAEEAFYFDKYGLINEKDLISFVGASNGRIKDWKDQSVSGLKYSNDTLSTMPYIVKSGVVCKDSRKIICPRFDGTEFLSLINTTQFKKLHDGTKYTSILDYQLDTGVISYFIIGNSVSDGETGFSYLGNNFIANALHVFVRSAAATVVQDLSVTANIYNKAIRSVNVLDPSNGVANQRLHTLIQEVERNGNASTGTPSSSNPTNNVVTIGKSSIFDMVGYIPACIFIEGDYFVDRFKHSRSLIKP